MEPGSAVTLLFLTGAVMFLFMIAWAIPVRLYIEALSAGVKVGIELKPD